MKEQIEDLVDSMDALDLQIEKFNKFTANFKSFKLKSYVAISIASMLTGAGISYFSINHFLKNDSKSIKNKSKYKEIFEKYKLNFRKNEDGSVDIYVRKKDVVSVATGENNDGTEQILRIFSFSKSGTKK